MSDETTTDTTATDAANAALSGENNATDANAALANANTGDGESKDDAAGQSAQEENSEGGDNEGKGKEDAKSESETDPFEWAKDSGAEPALLEVANPVLDGMGLNDDQKKSMLGLYQDIQAKTEADYIEALNTGAEAFMADADLWDGTKPTEKVMTAFATLRTVSPEANAFLDKQAKFGSLVDKGLADIAMLVAKGYGEGNMHKGEGESGEPATMYPNTKFNK